VSISLLGNGLCCFGFAKGERKNSAHEFSIHTVLCTVNRLLAERRARVDFKKPWDFVFGYKKNFEFRRGDFNTTKVPLRDFCTEKLFFLPLLDKIRTFFKENPDVDF